MWQEKDNKLYKKYEFSSFDEAIKFVNDVARISKTANHHPKIINSYNVVEIFLSTHSAGDKITDKDRSLAQEIDNLNRKKPTQQMIAKIFTDGGSRGNPGPSATGYVIFDADGNTLEKGSKYLGVTTNNQAEYIALNDALKKAVEIGIESAHVNMDSLLIINQINGLYKVKKAELLPLYAEVKSLEREFKDISFNHVRREFNSVADGLVNKCLDDNQ